LSEWAALYADPECELPPIDVSFRDYCQAVEAAGEDEKARAYWLDRLDTLPTAPELPLLAPRQGEPTRFVRRTRTVSRERWTRLKERAQARGVTPSVLLCAAYAEALALWAKEPRFTLNVTIGDRLPLHPHVERLIGDFTNLVLLEVDTAGEGSFEARAQALQRQLFQDLEHRAFGGVRVIRELAREHGPAHAAMPVVFTSVLGHEMPGGSDGVLPGLGRLLDGVSQTPQVHLDCQVLEIAGELMISWDAVEALFPEGVLDAAFDAYVSLAEALGDDEAVWTSAGPVTTPAEHRAVVAEVNATERPLPTGLLHEPFFARAARTPHAPAVIWSSGRLTYGELAGRAGWVADRLAELGVRPGERVVISMRKGWEQVAAVLGVLRAGGVYVPVDPALPAERITYLIEHTEARAVLTQPGLMEEPWPSGVPVVAITAEGAGLGPGGHTASRAATDLAYVIFTSGSTGVPKGVMIDHRGARNTIEDINERIGLTAEDRVLAVSSLSFDLSVWDVFGTLAVGAAVVMPDPGSERDPAHWGDLVDAHGVTVWNSVPALFELYTEHRAQHGPRAGLRTAMLSGDWIPLSLPERAWETFPGVRVMSLGGATEASIWSIHHPVTEVDPTWASIPYGTALANQTMHVLDGRLRVRPPYATGGIFIGGVGTALGYWKDEEKTARSFVVHPETGERLYRTGDLGRFWPDGTIEFLGREDQQVKVNGYRIELGEIDAALTAHPQVGGAVTITDTAGQGGKRLVSYVTQDGAVDTAALREWLEAKIPSYMVPQVLVVLEEIPLTGNGKVDRKALPSPSRTQNTAVHTPAATPVEHALVQVWSELLNPSEPLSTTANLFELGADSLLALRATAGADRHGLRLQLADVFAHPTITGQALAADSASVGATRDDPVGPTGMTPSQHWFLSQDLPRRHHWNDASFLLALQRPLDPAVLARALGRILEHHDALRLRFAQDAGGGWTAHVAPWDEAEQLPFEVHDLSHLDSRAQKKRSVEISDGLQAGLDLGRGPLLRMAYFDMGDRPHCVLFLAHWLAVDHYSGRILLEDLLGCYADLEAGGEGALPPRTTSFRSWTHGLAVYANSPEVTAESGHWASEARRSIAPFPVDDTQGPNSLESLENVTVRVDRDVTDALVRLLPRHIRADLSEVLCSAALRALHATYPDDPGTRRVLVDLERHGRDLPVPGANVSRTVGRFSTLVPVLLELDPALAPDEALHRVRDQVDALPGRGAGHGLLTYLSDRPEAEALRGLPVAQIGVNYLGQVDEVFLRSDLLSVPRMAYGRQRSDTGTRFRAVDVIGFVVAGRLNLTVGFSTNRHSAATRKAFTAALTDELGQLARWVRHFED
ncbi:amino acid adenylation domain-containing protein, partial [Streptomyces coerulescens]|uniref:amino acid adenylation domain-containing protein n=1 Tax=Streptomyces coerulescens TaxID=29304 RepID=UPI0036D2CC07